MAFTKRFAIIADFPLFWDPAKLAENVHRPTYVPELGSRFGLVPRDGVGEVRSFSASPTYVLHFSNAYEDGDDVVIEGYHQAHPTPERTPADNAITLFMKSLDLNAMKTRLHRWRLNTKTGATTEEFLDDRFSEFPSIHAGYAGRKHRYVYAALGEPGYFLFNGFVRTDLATGAQATHRLPKGVFASEAPFCPRLGATSEDDGYLVTFTIDMNADASACQIFDARALERGAIARVRLPMRISSGTHATWAPLSTPSSLSATPASALP